MVRKMYEKILRVVLALCLVATVTLSTVVDSAESGESATPLGDGVIEMSVY